MRQLDGGLALSPSWGGLGLRAGASPDPGGARGPGGPDRGVRRGTSPSRPGLTGASGARPGLGSRPPGAATRPDDRRLLPAPRAWATDAQGQGRAALRLPRLSRPWGWVVGLARAQARPVAGSGATGPGTDPARRVVHEIAGPAPAGSSRKALELETFPLINDPG
jgi:hypothetical protein